MIVRSTERDRQNTVAGVKSDAPIDNKPLSCFFRVLWTLLIILIYFVAGNPFGNLLGQWPAPYWLSVALGVFLLYGFAGKNFKQLAWIIPMFLLGYVTVWFGDLGIYRLLFYKWLHHHAKWYFQSEWADKIPVAIFMAVVMLGLFDGKGRLRRSVLFAEFLFFMVLIGNMLVGFYLPIEGACGIDGFNYDAYGFRLGANFLVATGVSFWLAKEINVLISKLSKNQKP